jgi:hypothetical protein
MKFVDKVEREAARRERVAARAAARENPHGESEIEIERDEEDPHGEKEIEIERDEEDPHGESEIEIERDEEDPHGEKEIEINSNSEKPIQVWPLFLSKKRKREQDHEIEPDDGNEQLHEQQHENEHEIEPDDGKRLLVPLGDHPHNRIGGFSCPLAIHLRNGNGNGMSAAGGEGVYITTDQMDAKHKQKNGRKKRERVFDEGQNERRQRIQLARGKLLKRAYTA